MVKTPRTRHSKTEKEPVTIDLAPGDVARVSAATEQAGDATSNVETVSAENDAAAVHAAEPAGEAGDNKQDASATATAGSEEAAVASADSAGTPKADSGNETSRPREDRRSTAASSTTFGRKETAASPPPAAPRRSGALAGGVAGGVIALLIAGGLQYAGFVPGLGRSAPTDAAPVAALEEEIAQLKARLDALGQAGNGGDDALGGRVTQAEERVTSLQTELEQLRGQVAALGTGEPGQASSVDLGPLEARIASIESTLASLDAGGAGSSTQDVLATVEGQFSSLRQAIAALRTGADQFAGEVTLLRDDLAASREAQTSATGRVDALEQSVRELASKVDEQAAMPGTAAIIAASALKAAIDRGLPFTTELETYASLAPDAPEVAELRSYAAAGVPTRSQISAESDSAANAMIAAARPIDPQAGFVDKLWGSAMGLVQVRPIGMVEGDDVPQVVARLDAAVQTGDYARAIAEFDSLPDVAKAAGDGFMTKVKARHAADQLVDQALAAALKA